MQYHLAAVVFLIGFTWRSDLSDKNTRRDQSLTRGILIIRSLLVLSSFILKTQVIMASIFGGDNTSDLTSSGVPATSNGLDFTSVIEKVPAAAKDGTPGKITF